MITVYGPYIRADGRKHVIIYDHETKKRQTKSYPKYLLEQKLGRDLVGDETADHVDEDFTNDKLDNLQVLSREENARKAKTAIYGEVKEIKCEFCHKLFMPKDRKRRFCSRSCGQQSRWYEPLPV